ncbi:hypothetical protein Purlil1_12328 [Purpureocillium lilacinum]|uniref:PAS domain-containing protein n=1 Tax=Purpureocillium lilacinum TaxID=33203 RepID=A0ABR0BH99_PURLI|nr:hypothetical protein Purlil1_12328 [Purpureocillium lilacinum]
MGEIFDYSPVPTLLISPSLRIQRASASLLVAWGVRRGELLERDLCITLYNGSQTERFDRIPLLHAVKSAVATRTLGRCYAAYIANDITWDARIIPVHRDDELLCLIFEWERTETHTTIVDSEIVRNLLPIDDALRIFIQAVKDYAIFLLDTRGNVVTWNAGAEVNQGYKKGEVIGKHFSMLYGEEDVQTGKLERQLEIGLREGRAETECWHYRKDGSRYRANVLTTAIYKNDVHIGFVNISRNFTGRRS